MSLKNSSDTIGNRTRDLPAFSTMPQPTAPPRIPGVQGKIFTHNSKYIHQEYRQVRIFGNDSTKAIFTNTHAIKPT
jgi:hypothetical protein